MKEREEQTSVDHNRQVEGMKEKHTRTEKRDRDRRDRSRVERHGIREKEMKERERGG